MGGVLKIRKITPSGVVSTFSEDKILSMAMTSDNENNIYLAGSYYGSIYRYTPLGIRSTIKEMEGFFQALVRDEQGNLYYTESGPFIFSIKHQVFKLSTAGIITVIAGAGMEASGYVDGKGNIARFNNPDALAIDAQGNIFLSDFGNLCIRKIIKN